MFKIGLSKFIRNFAQYSVSLHTLTKRNGPFCWTSQHQNAFTYLKHALSNPLVVSSPNFTLPFSLYTDASGSATGAMLAQKQGHQKKTDCLPKVRNLPTGAWKNAHLLRKHFGKSTTDWPFIMVYSVVKFSTHPLSQRCIKLLFPKP